MKRKNKSETPESKHDDDEEDEVPRPLKRHDAEPNELELLLLRIDEYLARYGIQMISINRESNPQTPNLTYFYFRLSPVPYGRIARVLDAYVQRRNTHMFNALMEQGLQANPMGITSIYNDVTRENIQTNIGYFEAVCVFDNINFDYRARGEGAMFRLFMSVLNQDIRNELKRFMREYILLSW